MTSKFDVSTIILQLNQFILNPLYDRYYNRLFAVGGIYTVIKTKAAETVAEYGEQYFLFGPYKESAAKLEVEVIETPAHYAIKDTISQMKEHGIKVDTEQEN